MLILGSQSPRRKEILHMANIPFRCEVIDVCEDVVDDDPKEYVLKTALKKGLSYLQKFPFDVVLCADTIVEVDNEILEKPKNMEDAKRMIKDISGRSHYVHTAVFLGDKESHDLFLVTTKVYVSALTDEEISEYVALSEPYDKAGAYAIQGIFGKYIEKIDGDYYNVMGLPLCEVNKRLKKYIK